MNDTSQVLTGFPGQYYDAETGLHYNLRRYQDPRTGRYLTPDPIGLRAGINLYPYVLNNPINAIDRLGLRPLSIAEKMALEFYFGPSLSLDVINLEASSSEYPMSPWGNEIRLPKGYFKNSNPCEDVDLSNAAFFGRFAHEATHVWQRQQGRSVTGPALIGYFLGWATGTDPYGYQESPDPIVMLNTFLQGKVDQQAQIVEDFVTEHQYSRYRYTPQYHELWTHLLTVEKSGRD